MSIVINNSSLTLANASVSVGIPIPEVLVGLPDAPTITDAYFLSKSCYPNPVSSVDVYLTFGNDNGYPLTDVEWSVDNGITFTNIGYVTTVLSSVQAPQDGTPQNLIVRVKNEIGYSPNSNVWTLDTTGYVDSSYLFATVIPSNTCCGGGEISITDITLQSNAWDGGLPIVVLQYSIDAGVTWSSVPIDPPISLIPDTPHIFETPIVISGLTNGTEYPVKVRIGNQNDVDLYNASGIWQCGPTYTFLTTPSTIPEAPTLDSIYNDGFTTLLYFTLNGDGGSPVTYMDFSYQDSYWSSGFSTTSPLTVTGWSPGITYDFGVRAVNVNGVSATSNIIRTQGWAQNAPTLTSVNSGDGSLDVYFTLNDNVNLDPTTDVQYSIDNESSWVSIGTITSPFTITGLTNGYLYEVRLRTDNGYFGPRSNMISGTPSE